jgi:hypothetical protein
MIRGFQFAFGPGTGVGLMVKQAIGKGTAYALMEKHEGESHLDAFVAETINNIIQLLETA